MEKKINLVELLRDCPTGMELDCTMYDNVEFEGISDNKDWPIKISVEGYPEVLNPYGCFTYRDYSKCVIFPKGKTTWEDFVPPIQFKDGDVVSTGGGRYIYILNGEATREENCYKGKVYFGYCVYTNKTMDNNMSWHFSRLATEEEKQKLFDAIKANGYKWNDKTKTLEKLIEPKFKVGDIIEFKYHERSPESVVKVKDNGYILSSGRTLMFQDENAWELCTGKFDLTTLKPFESRVLVRHNKDNKWCGSFFSHIDEDFHSHCYKFVTTAGKSYPYCIPYKDNEHLLGTTNDCGDYYKTWE